MIIKAVAVFFFVALVSAQILSRYLGIPFEKGNADGHRLSAQLQWAQGICFATNGTMFLGAVKVRRVNISTGEVTTLVRRTTQSDLYYFEKEDTTGVDIFDSNICGCTFTPDGNIYFISFVRKNIHRLKPSGELELFAGSSSPEAPLEGHRLQVSMPASIQLVSDRRNNLYFVDNGNKAIRMLNITSGIVSFLPILPCGPISVSVDHEDNLYSGCGDGSLHKYSLNRESYSLLVKTGVRINSFTCDTEGSIYYSDNTYLYKYNISTRKSYMIAGNGSAGFQDGQGTDTMINEPYSMAFDANHVLYMVERRSYIVRKVLTCNPGKEWNETLGRCTFCEQGFIKSDDGTVCKRCPLGQEPVSLTDCSPCAPGKMRLLSQTGFCVDCPENASCSSAIEFQCNSSFVLNERGDGCVQCPLGQEPSQNKSFCIPCKDGTHRSNTDSGFCEDCPANGICINGILDCIAGYEPNEDKSKCLDCPFGKYRSHGTKCIDCPENSLCNSTGFSCLSGFTESRNGSHCMECPDGYIKSEPGNFQCSKCPIGTEHNTTKTECKECPHMKYKPSDHHDICIDCPEGARCNSTLIIACLIGFMPSLDSSKISMTCEQCPQGFYKSTEGNHMCSSCPSGTYSSDDFSSCLNCPAGEYKLPVIGTCAKCDEGTESNRNRTGCTPCPNGYTKPNNIDFQRCHPCPLGSVCTPLNFTCSPGFQLNARANGCTKCSFGWKKSGISNSSCEICPLGMQSNIHRTECQSCPSGYYRSDLISPFCVPCPQEGVSFCEANGFMCKQGWEKTHDEYSCQIISILKSATMESLLSESAKGRSIDEDTEISSPQSMLVNVIMAVSIMLLIVIVGVSGYVIYHKVMYISHFTDYSRRKNKLLIDFITASTSSHTVDDD